MSTQVAQDKTPFFSIIIPVYNAEKHLCSCIKSILFQTFRDFELILVDDGSGDASHKICQYYEAQDSRIKYFRKTNRGCFQARLFGAEKSCGEYILFCDADDYYINKTVFQRIKNLIDKYKCDFIQFGYRKKYYHLTIDRCCTDHVLIPNATMFYSVEYQVLLGRQKVNAHITTQVWNKVYCRSLLANLPPSDDAERLFMGEDLVINLYLLEKCTSPIFDPSVLYVYRDFLGGTTKYSLATMNDLDTVRKYQLLFIDRGKLDKKKYYKALYHENAGWFYAWVKEGIPILGEEKMLSIVEQTLALPSFHAAHLYFREHIEETWNAANLLRSGNAEEYIIQAKRDLDNQHFNIKNRVLAAMKTIYKSI